MMIDPTSYRKEFEDATLDEVLQERDSLIEYMKDYENHKLPIEDYCCNPDPYQHYVMYIEYLREIFDLIIIKM